MKKSSEIAARRRSSVERRISSQKHFLRGDVTPIDLIEDRELRESIDRRT